MVQCLFVKVKKPIEITTFTYPLTFTYKSRKNDIWFKLKVQKKTIKKTIIIDKNSLSASFCYNWERCTKTCYFWACVQLQDGLTFSDESDLLYKPTKQLNISIGTMVLHQWSHEHLQTLLDLKHKILVACMLVHTTNLLGSLKCVLPENRMAVEGEIILKTLNKCTLALAIMTTFFIPLSKSFLMKPLWQKKAGKTIVFFSLPFSHFFLHPSNLKP